MKVYFYHTQDIQHILQQIEKQEFPPHFLYGATLFSKHGVDVVWHKSKLNQSRWKMMLRTTWRILTCKESFDAVYATHYRGLELIVFLRALHLFRKPVIVWHHQPIIKSPSKWREWLGKLFYKGFDELFFFSQKLVNDSCKTAKYPPQKMHLGHWGADLKFYDSIRHQTQRTTGFISTGKELRDMPTLIKAFNAINAPLDIYINEQNGDVNYNKVFANLTLNDNIKVHQWNRLAPYELALEVNKANCVVICCQESKYTVGLTTVVEALALGLPIICSRNPQIPIDFDKDGCGISVPYYDVENWIKAIEYITQNPTEAAAMGARGRALAEREYNNEKCAEVVTKVIKKYDKKA